MPEFKVAMHEMRGQMLEKNNQDVQAFIDAASILLKAKGWKYEGQKLQSALYHRAYSKDGFVIEITGWHGGGRPGTNRFYGAAKSFLYLYHRQGFKTVSKIDVNLHDCDTFKEIIDNQAAGMDKALKFLAKV